MIDRLSSILLVVLAFGWMAAQHPAVAQHRGADVLANEIRAIIHAEEFGNAFWGVTVVDLSSGRILFDENAGKSFVPASNMKLYTTAAALDQLGPTYQYRTSLYIDGVVEDGVLDGNLIVRGAADPSIGTHYDAATGKWEADVDATRLFRDWADALRAEGISQIRGDIIGDDDVVDDVPLGHGWSWDDETFYYAAQLSGLSFNDNVVHVHVEGRQRGEPANVWWDPFNTKYVDVLNRSITRPAGTSVDEGYRRLRGTNTVEVTTRVPSGGKDVEEITVENPTLFFVHVLRESLQQSGIAVAGSPVDVDAISIKPNYLDPRLRRVATHVSLPLSEIVKITNKPSMNLFADMLIKTLAAEFPRPHDEDRAPGSSSLGLDIAMATFVKAGIDTSRMQLADGSGLSRHNLITPAMTASLLQYMWSHPDDRVRQAFYGSLPVAGVEGTLRNRLKSGPAHQKLRAKTGSLSNVSSLSGYVESADGTTLAFVMMSNHYTTKTSAVRRAQDRIANLLARYRR